jgi:hypothetical protein
MTGNSHDQHITVSQCCFQTAGTLKRDHQVAGGLYSQEFLSLPFGHVPTGPGLLHHLIQ